MRKLVTVKQVTEIRPIEGADAIECAIIGGGWPVVVKLKTINTFKFIMESLNGIFNLRNKMPSQ